VIDFAETLAPGSEIGSLSSEDRYVLATLIKWAQDPQFLAGDVSIILIAENLAEMSPPPWVVWLFYSHPPLTERIHRGEAFVTVPHMLPLPSEGRGPEG